MTLRDRVTSCAHVCACTIKEVAAFRPVAIYMHTGRVGVGVGGGGGEYWIYARLMQFNKSL